MPTRISSRCQLVNPTTLVNRGMSWCVISAGDLDTSNMGGQSVTVAKSMGFVGAIVNGAVRDVDTICNTGYPVWSKGVTPMTGKFRMQAMELNGPVTVHDIMVEAGDLIVADSSGVCAIPSGLIEIVLEKVKVILAEEANMRGPHRKQMSTRRTAPTLSQALLVMAEVGKGDLPHAHLRAYFGEVVLEF